MRQSGDKKVTKACLFVVCKNSRSTVVLAEYLGPLLASSSESISHNVPQPFKDGSCWLDKLPESRVTVANGGFQCNL